MLTDVALTVALLVAVFVVLGSLSDWLRRRNRGRFTPWSRRISLAVVLAVILVAVVGLRWIW